jgi:hypothetical protein
MTNPNMIEKHRYPGGDMPPVLFIPTPECCEGKHRHAPAAQDACVKDVVFAALGANPVAMLNVFSRERGWLKQVHVKALQIGVYHHVSG